MSFARQRFAIAVCDEVQKIKNAASQIRRAATTINARFRIAMTGTPVENRLQDLWTIMDWSWPKLLGASRDFERRFPEDDAKALIELRSQLVDRRESQPQVMLRRMKSEVLDGLPEKRIVKYEIEMPPIQAAHYSRAIEQAMLLRGSGRRWGLCFKVLHELRGASLFPRSPDGAEFSPEESTRLQTISPRSNGFKRPAKKCWSFAKTWQCRPSSLREIRHRLSLNSPSQLRLMEALSRARQQIVNEFQSRPAGF